MLMKFSENAELLVRVRLESDKIKYLFIMLMMFSEKRLSDLWVKIKGLTYR